MDLLAEGFAVLRQVGHKWLGDRHNRLDKSL